MEKFSYNVTDPSPSSPIELNFKNSPVGFCPTGFNKAYIEDPSNIINSWEITEDGKINFTFNEDKQAVTYTTLKVEISSDNYENSFVELLINVDYKQRVTFEGYLFSDLTYNKEKKEMNIENLVVKHDGEVVTLTKPILITIKVKKMVILVNKKVLY